MRNRAKCKLCGDILESFHRTDYVECSCGEIAIDGGDQFLKCSARDWGNFFRIDDNNNEIPVRLESAKEKENCVGQETHKPTKLEIVEELKQMAANIEKLPENAAYSPITHYDFWAALVLIVSALEMD